MFKTCCSGEQKLAVSLLMLSFYVHYVCRLLNHRTNYSTGYFRYTPPETAKNAFLCCHHLFYYKSDKNVCTRMRKKGYFGYLQMCHVKYFYVRTFCPEMCVVFWPIKLKKLHVSRKDWSPQWKAKFIFISPFVKIFFIRRRIFEQFTSWKGLLMILEQSWRRGKRKISKIQFNFFRLR